MEGLLSTGLPRLFSVLSWTFLRKGRGGGGEGGGVVGVGGVPKSFSSHSFTPPPRPNDQWFKSYGHFTEGVDLAYKWSFIGRSRLVLSTSLLEFGKGHQGSFDVLSKVVKIIF